MDRHDSVVVVASLEMAGRFPVEAKLVRLTPGELEGYLVRLSAVTRVVRWNGVPVALQEAVQRAEQLGDGEMVAAHGPDVFVTAR